jgi:hypothetical protein
MENAPSKDRMTPAHDPAEIERLVENMQRLADAYRGHSIGEWAGRAAAALLAEKKRADGAMASAARCMCSLCRTEGTPEKNGKIADCWYHHHGKVLCGADAIWDMIAKEPPHE